MSKNNAIQLSDHFDYKRLFRFVIAPICTMVFTSLYSIVDGFFVSNYVGSTAFASLNLVYPYLMLIAAVGFMFGTGGTALVSMHLGQGENEKARSYFSLIVYTMIGIGLVLSGISAIVAPEISKMLGANEEMLPYCVTYLRINMIGSVPFMLSNLFQSFLIAAEKPRLGFVITLIAGCTNMVLDWLIVGMLNGGLAGAAWATITSQCVAGFVPLVYFMTKKPGILRLGKTRFEMGVLTKACGNGASEFLSNVSASVVGFLYNLQLMKYAGEDGVSAYGVLMYVCFIFVAIFIGYSMGVAPVVAFNYGAENKKELQNIFGKSVKIIGIANLLMLASSELLADPLVRLFVGYDPELYSMTVRGMRIFSIAFLVAGFNIFASAFFTALNNGKVSAILSVTRTLVLQLIMIYLLPTLFGTDGLWAVEVAVDGFGIIMTVFFILKNRKKYGYMAERSKQT